LFIAREAMDTHVRQILPLLSKKGNKFAHFTGSFLPFYMSWYPKQWLPAPTNQKTKNLNGSNRAHLHYIARASKRLARTMFHTMAKYQQKLEREQLILGNFVDIGTYLFAMAATLAYTDALLDKTENKQALQDICDLFCRDARDTIERAFTQVKTNHNSLYTRVAQHTLDGKFDWFCTGVYEGTPPGYLKYMNQSIIAYEERMKAKGVKIEAPEEELVAK